MPTIAQMPVAPGHRRFFLGAYELQAIGDLFRRSPPPEPPPETLSWSPQDHRVRARVLEFLADGRARGRAARHRYVAAEIEARLRAGDPTRPRPWPL